MYLLPKGALFLAECEKGRRARGGIQPQRTRCLLLLGPAFRSASAHAVPPGDGAAGRLPPNPCAEMNTKSSQPSRVLNLQGACPSLVA